MYVALVSSLLLLFSDISSLQGQHQRQSGSVCRFGGEVRPIPCLVIDVVYLIVLLSGPCPTGLSEFIFVQDAQLLTCIQINCFVIRTVGVVLRFAVDDTYISLAIHLNPSKKVLGRARALDLNRLRGKPVPSTLFASAGSYRFVDCHFLDKQFPRKSTCDLCCRQLLIRLYH